MSENGSRKIVGIDVSYLLLLFSAIITSAVIAFVYFQTQTILKERLRERLTGIVGTAALQFNSQELGAIQDAEDITKPELKSMIDRMKKIRDVNLNLKYIYIWRKTEDPMNIAFVVDAEMLEPIDRNNDGEIDGEEVPPIPGELYEADQVPNLEEGFIHPIAQEDFIVDKWGTFLSGLAPIKDENGNTIAVLGIDVEVGDFNNIIRATLIPFILLATALFLLLTFQTISLVRIWRSRVEIVKEIDHQKDELLSIVSHQLATPVASVKWYIEMLLDGDLGELNNEQKNHLKTVEQSTKNLSDLVSMILDVSRIQLGRINIEPQEMDLNELFADILATVKPKAVERHIDFRVDLQNPLPIAMLDRRYTRMTIENLMTNAVKYTPEKGLVQVRIHVEKGILKIMVKDTGCGIPLADQKNIFGKMFRASNVRNSAIDGNGFGLYVAKGAVESQGGKIWFESEQGKGTAFYVDLPVVSPKNEIVAPPENLI